MSRDRIDFQSLPENEKHIFISNLKYQILLDSVQGRSPNVAFLPLVSLPEQKRGCYMGFSETIHGRTLTFYVTYLMTQVLCLMRLFLIQI